MEWRIVDHAMRSLARDKASFDAEEAGWLLEAARVRVWTHVGLGSLTEYLERVIGYTPRQVAERMRVAIALEALPRMRRALAAGELPWSAVRELSRIADAETEHEWIEEARGKTVREVEAMVAGRKEGDRPSDPTGPIDRVRHVHYEVSGETLPRCGRPGRFSSSRSASARRRRVRPAARQPRGGWHPCGCKRRRGGQDPRGCE